MKIKVSKNWVVFRNPIDKHYGVLSKPEWKKSHKGLIYVKQFNDWALAIESADRRAYKRYKIS